MIYGYLIYFGLRFEIFGELCKVISLMEEPITVEVVYEWKPTRCHTCKVFGHSCKLSETKENGKEKGKEKEIGEAQLSKVGCLGPIVIRGHPPASQKACHEVGTREGGKEANAEGGTIKVPRTKILNM